MPAGRSPDTRTTTLATNINDEKRPKSERSAGAKIGLAQTLVVNGRSMQAFGQQTATAERAAEDRRRGQQRPQPCRHARRILGQRQISASVADAFRHIRTRMPYEEKSHSNPR